MKKSLSVVSKPLQSSFNNLSQPAAGFASFTVNKTLRRSYLTTAFTSSKAVLTVLGGDRVGIIKDVTGIVLDHGGNILDSNSTALGGKFSSLMLVEIAEENVKLLRDDLKKSPLLEGISVETDITSDDQTPVNRATKYAAYRLKLEGLDNPGLVNTLISYFASIGANIDGLKTKTSSAPFGGTVLFELEGVLTSSEALKMEEVNEKLDEFSNLLGVTISLEQE
mmetsp:Transcript_23686/g.26852  ORF Transcript_23686/g.26852 Transcript_23686/m.26852 type:complete len:223 (+) Transcript_23686:125-793(+)